MDETLCLLGNKYMLEHIWLKGETWIMSDVQVIPKGNSKRHLRKEGIGKYRKRVGVYVRVSTGSEEQMSSYHSQVLHYREYVESKSEWQLIKIYADEAITGTSVGKRGEFQWMVQDAIDGKLDLIITKSISRFARNTLDTLKYVRLLKEKNVAIFFEKENINTLTMNGEMLLVILSSLAQQESESISTNVKMGLKMKMKRGEMVGFNGCLGYDYDPIHKVLTINEEESKIVQMIFSRYLEGAGCYVIARELTELGIKTSRGNDVWHESVIRRILKNEKYVGDVLLGKTITVDPLTHRRVDNLGEEEMYYVKAHHEAIVSKEDYDTVQKIFTRRSRNKMTKDDRRYDEKTRLYAFSSRIKCGLCDGNFSRRTWHAGSRNEKNTWECRIKVKVGKQSCSHSKSFQENTLEECFVDAFNHFQREKGKYINDYVNENITNKNQKELALKITNIQKAIYRVERIMNELVDLKIGGQIHEDIYNRKMGTESEKLNKLTNELADFEQMVDENDFVIEALKSLQKSLNNKKQMIRFDRNIFDELCDYVIIGEAKDEDSFDPYALTFVFKTGLDKTKTGMYNIKDVETELYSLSKDEPC